MMLIFDPVIKGHPYPIAAGAHFGYRCYVDGKWNDCDQYGNIKENAIDYEAFFREECEGKHEQI